MAVLQATTAEPEALQAAAPLTCPENQDHKVLRAQRRLEEQEEAATAAVLCQAAAAAREQWVVEVVTVADEVEVHMPQRPTLPNLLESVPRYQSL